MNNDNDETNIPVTIGQTISPTNLPVEPTPIAPTPLEAQQPAQAPIAPEIQSSPIEPTYSQPPIPVEPEPPMETPLPQNPASTMPIQAPQVSQVEPPTPSAPEAFVPIMNEPPKGPNKKLPLMIAGATALLLVVVAGAYFGLVVPNKPENVYKSAMNRSGKVFKSTVDSYTGQDYINKVKKTETNANLKYESKDANIDGKFNLKADTKKAVADVEINSPLGKVTSKAIAITPENSDYPDVYFQVSGLKTVTPLIGSPGLESLDGKWIEVNHTLFKQMIAQSSENEKYDPIKPEDVTDLANNLAQPTVERAFGTDKKTAVFVNTSFVGKETVDGKKTNHYIVKVNKDNLKAYEKAIIEATYSSKLFKKLNTDAKQEDLDKQKVQAIESANKEIDSIGADDSFDAWIDRSSKLIYKVKVTDKKNDKNFFEIGQNYKKGDEIPLFININTEEPGSKSTTDIKITANKKSSNLKLEGVSDFNGGLATGKLTYRLEINPYTGEIKAEKPTETVPITDVMKALGYDPASLTAPLGQ